MSESKNTFADFWQQINQRPEWVRITCVGFGSNALLLLMLIAWDRFRPFGLGLPSIGFGLLSPAPVVFVFVVYLVLSGGGLWFGRKWGLVFSSLFPLTFVVLGLMGLVRFWFIPVMIMLGIYAVVLVIGVRRGMKWLDVVKTLFAISFVLVILFAAFNFWFEDAKSSLLLFAASLYGGLRWVWELGKLWKTPFFNT